MKHSYRIINVCVLLTCLVSCASHYEVSDVKRSVILIDSKYDTPEDAGATAFMAPYKQRVDSIMSPVVGKAAEELTSRRPEGKLGNLLADILVWSGGRYGEAPDFAITNMGGIRASIRKGDVTYGDVLDVSPFENKVSFVTLKGTAVEKLFEQVARRHGEAVSHAVELVITPDGKLVSSKINGNAVDKTRDYRVATLDFLAQGNDNMPAFREKRNEVVPQPKGQNFMDVIVEYFREQQRKGIEVDSKIEGRITVRQ